MPASCKSSGQFVSLSHHTESKCEDTTPAVATLHPKSCLSLAASRSHNPRCMLFHLCQHNLQSVACHLTKIPLQVKTVCPPHAYQMTARITIITTSSSHHTAHHHITPHIIITVNITSHTITIAPCLTRMHMATGDADSLFSEGLHQARCGLVSVPKPEPVAALSMTQPAIATTAPTEDLPGRRYSQRVLSPGSQTHYLGACTNSRCP